MSPDGEWSFLEEGVWQGLFTEEDSDGRTTPTDFFEGLFREAEEEEGSEEADRLERGSVWGGSFRLLEMIGKGGMGEVWRAEQVGAVRREVAVKFMSTRLGRRDRLRFAEEARILGRLRHPHIAPLYFAETTAEGRPFLAMELVEGTSLLRFVADEDLCLEEQLELFLQVCHGVDHAHRQGVIHRDLKPGNILVASGEVGPRATIIDFGIASMTGAAWRIAGTPGYMAPELLSDGESDVRGDVFALGVILCEMLSGEKPVECEDGNLRARTQTLATKEPRKPSVIAGNSRLRGNLDAVVLKACAREPKERYGSAGALREDLEKHLEGLLVEARSEEPFFREKQLARRYPRMVLALFLLIGGAVAGIWGLGSGIREAESARRAALESMAAHRAAERRTREGIAFLESLFSAADPWRNGGFELTAEEFLKRGFQEARTLEGARRERVEEILGEIYRRRGEDPPAPVPGGAR